MDAARPSNGLGRGTVDVPLNLKAALRRAEAVLNARSDLQDGAGYAQITARDAAGFDYRIFAMVRSSYVAGAHGSVRAVPLADNRTRIIFGEMPQRSYNWLYLLAILQILIALIAPDRGTALGLVGFGLGLAALLYGLSRYVRGSSRAMARDMAQSTGGRLSGAAH